MSPMGKFSGTQDATLSGNIYIYTHKHEVDERNGISFFFPHEERKSFIYADKLFFNVMNAVPYLSTKKNKVPVWHEILDR